MKFESTGLIMLVDDNPTDRFVHRRLLEIHKIGNEVIEFESAMEALNYLRDANNKTKIPDVILLDIMMPEMDGFGFLVHFANLTDTLDKLPKLFMLSSTDDEKDIQRVRNNPLVIKMLRKPFSPDSLKKSLSEL